MRWGLIAVVVLGACCPTVIVGEEVSAPVDADLAVELIHERYQEAFDSDRRTTAVTWVTRVHNDGKDQNAASLSCVDVWIVARPNERPSETSLAHEMAHCYAGHVPETGRCPTFWETDTSHSEVWIWGSDGLVNTVKQELSDLGL